MAACSSQTCHAKALCLRFTCRFEMYLDSPQFLNAKDKLAARTPIAADILATIICHHIIVNRAIGFEAVQKILHFQLFGHTRFRPGGTSAAIGVQAN